MHQQANARWHYIDIIVQQATMIAAATAGAVLVVTTLGWIRYSASRWKSQLLRFRKDYHGYTTALGNEVDSLLIVCPASGGGLAMRGYDECLNALEQRGLKVEVYVTQSTDDGDPSHYHQAF